LPSGGDFEGEATESRRQAGVAIKGKKKKVKGTEQGEMNPHNFRDRKNVSREQEEKPRGGIQATLNFCCTRIKKKGNHQKNGTVTSRRRSQRRDDAIPLSVHWGGGGGGNGIYQGENLKKGSSQMTREPFYIPIVGGSGTVSVATERQKVRKRVWPGAVSTKKGKGRAQRDSADTMVGATSKKDSTLIRCAAVRGWELYLKSY